MKLLLDEMYGTALANELRDRDIDAVTVGELHLRGAPDDEVFRIAQTEERAVLTENVGDFTRLAADYGLAGKGHAGLIIALSARFSRRPAGRRPLVDAICGAVDEAVEHPLRDRGVYLHARQPGARS